MKLETTIGVLRDFVRSVKVLVDEVEVEIDAKGIHIMAVDLAHVAFIKSHLGKKAFTRYKFTKEERADFPLKLGLDFEVLLNFLDIAQHDERVRIEYDFKEEGKSISFRVRDLLRRIMLVEDDFVSTPKDVKLQTGRYTHTFSMKTSDLNWIVKAMNLTSDSVSMRAENDFISIIDHTLPDEMRAWTKIPGDFRLDGKNKDTILAHFPIDYFKSILSGIPSDDMTLTLGNDYPLKIDCDIESENEKVGNTTYLLAPRILG